MASSEHSEGQRLIEMAAVDEADIFIDLEKKVLVD